MTRRSYEMSLERALHSLDQAMDQMPNADGHLSKLLSAQTNMRQALDFSIKAGKNKGGK